jgi:transcription antitermination factor NusG
MAEWFILELSEQGEVAEYPEITSAIKTVFGSDTEFFIPVHHEKLGSYVTTNTLFPGYVFVKDSGRVKDNLSNIRDNRFFYRVLKNDKKFETVNSKEILGLRKKLKNSLKKKIRPGVTVKVKEGIFENLTGEVLSMEDDGKITNVRIKCLSREIIAPIPTTCLLEEIVTKDE